MEASSAHVQLEPEPREWQPRATWVGARLLCGATAFFFAAFLFAYFYLRSLDSNHAWTIGHVSAPTGFGVVIALVLVASAALLRIAHTRPDQIGRAGTAAVVLALASVLLQVIAWTTLGFGPASGGYASVYIGWTAFYAVWTLPCVYWMQTQVATARRAARPGAELLDGDLLAAGIEACSFFWTFYVAIGILTFVVLYLL
jgi:heme/copper-type cytochrome/quinol oxidase subunit 3